MKNINWWKVASSSITSTMSWIFSCICLMTTVWRWLSGMDTSINRYRIRINGSILYSTTLEQKVGTVSRQIDQKSIDDGKVWVRIRGTNPTVQKPVSEIQYDMMIPAVIFRYKGERCKRIVAIINLDIMVKD